MVVIREQIECVDAAIKMAAKHGVASCFAKKGQFIVVEGFPTNIGIKLFSAVHKQGMFYSQEAMKYGFDIV